MASLLHHFVVALAFLLCIVNAKPTKRVCKVLPSTPNWPSIIEWEKFNTTLGGVLLKPDAPAAPCHEGHPAYNLEKCGEVRLRWNSSQWHSDNPTSSLFQNWNGYSCLPNSTACTADGYPVYVVNATTADHVKAAVSFARERNIRLNIKSTGHDFLGRSVQPKSLSIWTHHMRSIKWHDSQYALRSCNVTLDGSFVTVGSGMQMRQLYRATSDRKLMVVGGDSATVSLGGYISGGGHSALSPFLGMAADQVVEVELVLADGSSIVANECSHPDIFWAVRGGGGSTFGVTTSFVIRAHPTVPVTAFNGWIFGNTSADANWDAIAHIHSQWPIRLSPFYVAGYFIGPGFHKSKATTLKIMMPNTTSVDSLKAALQPILDEAAAMTGGKVITNGTYTQYASYGDYLFPPAKTSTKRSDDASWFPGQGRSKLITSWLWDKKALANPGLKAALRNSVDNGTLMWSDFTAPGKAQFLRGGGNAVNPAWRGAIVRPASEMDWDAGDPSKLTERLDTLVRLGASLKSMDPDGGTYPNEADVQTVDYSHVFWGSNYPRLFDIKRKVDPDGIFWCKTCVGSELWEESAEGELCKKQE